MCFLKVWFKYNGQSWESNAFSIYTRVTANVDEESATQAVSAVLRYLGRVGVVKYTCHSGGRSPGDCHHQRAGILRH